MGGYLAALIYSAANFAVLYPGNRWRALVFALWFLFGASLPLGIIQVRYRLQLRRLGGVALAFVLHLSAAFLILNVWTFLATFSSMTTPSLKEALFLLSAALLWIAYGVTRAQRISVRHLTLKVFAPIAHAPIRIVAAADIHAGAIVERRYLKHLQKNIAHCRPDLFLLLGDVSDGDISCAVTAGLPEMLEDIDASLGKYAVLGNHDLYAGASASCSLLINTGFVVLQDETEIIDNVFVLAGRNDPRGKYFGVPRASLTSLIGTKNDGQPMALPVVVADHTPQNLEEAFDCGVALQLSGHTHGGQVFPFNLLMRWVYGISSGSIRKGATTVCVSSGAGLWTMPLRTVTNSEIVLCTLEFEVRSSDCSTSL